MSKVLNKTLFRDAELEMILCSCVRKL